ncbi:hypothetical protein G9A89_015572 [Geosiphon pyriformis]|nr:hypothetical protein G9A89_015572 [Geosiphon pyriformis]
MGACCGNDKEYSTMTKFYCQACYTILINNWVCKGTPINDVWKQALQQLEEYLHNEHELWRIASTKAEGVTISKLLEIKNNSLLLPEPDNNNDNDFNSDSNSNSNYKQYIALPDLTKEQKLKWFSDNNEGIMPKRAHDTDAEFDLRYSEKDAIKLEPHLCICIDLKIALEIPATTIIQLASKSNLTKRRINIREKIIDTGYVGNIIAMLQNNLEKAYVIEPNEKIVQAIFLPLVKIAQLVSIENREELRITARGIQEFGSMDRVDIPVNMVEEEIIDKEKIISTS